eukprot:scaffold316940_cov32-Tisochrysis_lutea.AAC.1
MRLAQLHDLRLQRRDHLGGGPPHGRHRSRPGGARKRRGKQKRERDIYSCGLHKYFIQSRVASPLLQSYSPSAEGPWSPYPAMG